MLRKIGNSGAIRWQFLTHHRLERFLMTLLAKSTCDRPKISPCLEAVEESQQMILEWLKRHLTRLIHLSGSVL